MDGDKMNNYNELTKQLQELPTISIRIDKKDMINQLRGLSDTYIELLINPEHLKTISLKDRTHYYTIQTKN